MDKQSTKLLYNKIILLSRNTMFYTKFDLIDTFENRIHLIFIHVSFVFIKIKQIELGNKYKVFHQKLFDLIFHSIELNMRELGYGDTTINKNMRNLVKNFYSILLVSEKYKLMLSKEKKLFFPKYLKFNTLKNRTNLSGIMEYFDKYEAFCFDLSPDSVLRGEFNFKSE